MSIANEVELNEFYQEKDPWQYQTTEDDTVRRDRLLSALPDRKFERVLDLGCGDGFVTDAIAS